MFEVGDKIRFKKLIASQDAFAPTPEASEYIPGEDNPGVSVPIDYEVEGKLHWPVIEGKAVYILRTKRNGIEVAGHMVTSRVKSVEPNPENESVIIRTENSVYVMERLI